MTYAVMALEAAARSTYEVVVAVTPFVSWAGWGYLLNSLRTAQLRPNHHHMG